MSCLFPTVGDKQPMILKWRILSATNDLDRVSAVALPKLPISLTNTDLKVANDTKFFPGLGKESLLLFGCCGVAAGAFGGSFCGRGYTGGSCFLTCGCLLSAGLALAFHDGSVHIVHRLSLQMMAVFYGSSSQRPVDEQTIKRQRTAGPLVHFKAMQLSWTSLALAGIDSHGKVLDFLAVGCALLFFFISLIGNGSFRKTQGMLPPAV